MLAQIVIDDKYIPALMHEVFTHGASGIRSNILHRCKLRSGCGYDNRIFHRTVHCQILHHLRNRGPLLPNCHIDTDDVLALLVQNRIRGYGGLACLTVTDDQFALTAANWNH